MSFVEKVISLYKPIGITPLQLIEQFREIYPEYNNVILGYAGRLDPMADGLLLVLVGEENKKRKQYEALSKEYEFEILLGIETDTYDTLGKITSFSQTQQDLKNKLEIKIPAFLGKHTQPYPPYSSQPVNGKPLYYWARANQLADIVIPTKEIEIYTLELISSYELTGKELQTIIQERVAKVTGNFRQKEILAMWDDLFRNHTNSIFPLFRLRISCSSGTYVRSLAHNLGKELKTAALALSITRTKVGEYTMNEAVSLYEIPPLRSG